MASRSPSLAVAGLRTVFSFDVTRLALLIALLALGIHYWNAPLLLPLKLLVVMMHETGHALASLVVGGQVERVVISTDESGSCLSALPPGVLGAIVVYSAGYLGSALAAAGLLLATFRYHLGRAVLGGLAVWLAVMALFYAGNAFTLTFCVLTACVLAAGARWLPDGAVRATNVLIASFSALYAVADLKDDLWTGSVRAQSDAHQRTGRVRRRLSALCLPTGGTWTAGW